MNRLEIGIITGFTHKSWSEKECNLVLNNRMGLYGLNNRTLKANRGIRKIAVSIYESNLTETGKKELVSVEADSILLILGIAQCNAVLSHSQIDLILGDDLQDVFGIFDEILLNVKSHFLSEFNVLGWSHKDKRTLVDFFVYKVITGPEKRKYSIVAFIDRDKYEVRLYEGMLKDRVPDRQEGILLGEVQPNNYFLVFGYQRFVWLSENVLEILDRTEQLNMKVYISERLVVRENR